MPSRSIRYGHRVQAETVDADVQPEIQDGLNLPNDRRIVVVEVRLMMEEPVPIVGLRDRIQVQLERSVSTKMMRASAIPLIGIAPHVIVALG